MKAKEALDRAVERVRNGEYFTDDVIRDLIVNLPSGKVKTFFQEFAGYLDEIAKLEVKDTKEPTNFSEIKEIVDAVQTLVQKTSAKIQQAPSQVPGEIKKAMSDELKIANGLLDSCQSLLTIVPSLEATLKGIKEKAQ
jgi:hypothetical protein